MHLRNSRVNNKFIKKMKIASSINSSTVCLDNLGGAILTQHLSGHFKRTILVVLRKESMKSKEQAPPVPEKAPPSSHSDAGQSHQKSAHKASTIQTD